MGLEPSWYSFNQEELQAFRIQLLEWFEKAGRQLPWRETKNPYLIWVSEIILQQTQIAQGWDYYLRITERFPTVSALADAPVEELLLLWQGLGYYSRAHNMHSAAQQIMKDYGGVFPKTTEEVASLKGVGPYTTAAIMSFAYDVPLAVVDGNVYRVLSRLTSSSMPIDTTKGQKHYKEVAQIFISMDDPSAYNQAIMDLGAIICTPLAPKCSDCPVSSLCKSRGNPELISLLPIKEKRTAVTPGYFDYFLFIKGDGFFVEQRDKKSIWKGLFQFPLVESRKGHLTDFELQKKIGDGWELLETVQLPEHRLTHRLLSIRVHICLSTGEAEIKSAQLLPIAEHHLLAFPIPLRKFLDSYFSSEG